MVTVSNTGSMAAWIPTATLLILAHLCGITTARGSRAPPDDGGQDLSGNSIANNPLKDGLANCSCYVTSSSFTPQNGPSVKPSNLKSDVVKAEAASSVADEQVYFTSHRFFDFRHLATRPGQFTTEPPELDDSDDGGDESVWPQYQAILNTTAFSNDWGIQTWAKKSTADFPVRVQNSAANIYISQNDQSDSGDGKGNDSIPETYLTLRTRRLPDFQSTAEMENRQKNVKYASIRFKLRVRGAAGAVAGLFTFADDVNESDIEILTTDEKPVWRFSNQPVLDKSGNEIDGASLKATSLPVWDDWRIGRIDWMPHVARFYVDGKLVAENTHSVPRVPSGVVLNMWSDGGEWSGNMTRYKDAMLDVAWVQMIFNTSGPVRGVDRSDQAKKRSVDLFGIPQSLPPSRRSDGDDDDDDGDDGDNGDYDEGDYEAHEFDKRGDKGCVTVCSIDDTPEQGIPKVVYVGAATSTLINHNNCYGALVLSLVAALVLI